MSKHDQPKQHVRALRAKGGVARARSLAPKRRSEISSNASRARWNATVLEVEYGGEDRPLRLGDVELPCYVLSDGSRVFSQRGMIEAFGMIARGGQLDKLLEAVDAKLSDDARHALGNPVNFRRPLSGGPMSKGYPVELLIDLCNALLDAERDGTLPKHYQNAAIRAAIFVRAVSKVGIVALVDEATGYEKERAANSLSQILEAFVAKELQPYLKTFPPTFYSELFRLRDLPYPNGQVKRPQFFGHLTNDIVYRRLAPGVLEELKRVVERDSSGRPKNKLFQMLSANFGYHKLREHLGAVIAIMQLSSDYTDFKKKLDLLKPVYGTQIAFALEELETDNGRGL